MNKIIINGNLTKDVEVTVNKNDVLVGKFTIANNTKVGKEERVTFINCVIFGDRVEKLVPYLLKGAKVLVDGRLEVNVVKNNELYNTYVNIYVDGLEILKFVNDVPKEEPKASKYSKYKKSK